MGRDEKRMLLIDGTCAIMMRKVFVFRTLLVPKFGNLVKICESGKELPQANTIFLNMVSELCVWFWVGLSVMR